ncbi:MAG: hypothetical protein ACI35O_06105 [Bacillaceae bacterium]
MVRRERVRDERTKDDRMKDERIRDERIREIPNVGSFIAASIDNGSELVEDSIRNVGIKLIDIDKVFEGVNPLQPFYIFIQLYNNGQPVGSYVFGENDTHVIEKNSYNGTVRITTAVRTVIPSISSPTIHVLIDFVYKGE